MLLVSPFWGLEDWIEAWGVPNPGSGAPCTQRSPSCPQVQGTLVGLGLGRI